MVRNVGFSYVNVGMYNIPQRNRNLQRPVNRKNPAFGNIGFENNLSQKQGMDAWKKVAIGLGIAGSLALAAYCIYRGKPVKYAEHIDFKRASNLEEAAKFAKENFHINKFDIKDLDIANYVNEGFANACNKTKGKIVLPRKIIENIDMDYVMLMECKGKGKLIINPQVYTKDYFIKFMKNRPVVVGNARYSPEQYWDILQTQNYNEKINFLSCILNKDISSDLKKGKFFALFHELGHLNHFAQNQELYEKFNIGTGNSIEVFKKHNYRPVLDIHEAHNKACKNLSSKVGAYASTYPIEYVADMYGHMLEGKTLSSDIMKIYNQYGGPNLG